MSEYDKASIEANPTNAVEFGDHRRQLFHKLVEIDTMSNLAKVTMKVVSPPVITSRTMTSGLQPGLGAGPAVVLGSTAMDSLTQIMFRGRVEAGDGYISPHYMWDDPCEVSLFKGDNNRLLQTICAHTLCISKIGYVGEMPKVGDKVTVLMKPSDVGPMSLQALYFQSLEDVVPPEQSAQISAENQLACDTLGVLFEGGVGSGGFGSNLNLTPPDHYNSMEYPSPVDPAKQFPYVDTIAERLAKEDDGLWPATVWLSETESVTVDGFYAPIIKGLPVKSLPQKDRPVPYEPDKTRHHKGTDVGTGASGDLLLYPCLPGIVFRGMNFKTGQPTNSNMAIINIVSPIEFEDGTKMTLTNRYMHLSMFGDNTSDGARVTWSSHPPPSIGASGGALGQVGAGGTSGPHLHWELRKSEFTKNVTSLPSGMGGEVLDNAAIYIGKSINPTNGEKSRTGAPPARYDDSDMVATSTNDETSEQSPG